MFNKKMCLLAFTGLLSLSSFAAEEEYSFYVSVGSNEPTNTYVIEIRDVVTDALIKEVETGENEPQLVGPVKVSTGVYVKSIAVKGEVDNLITFAYQNTSCTLHVDQATSDVFGAGYPMLDIDYVNHNRGNEYDYSGISCDNSSFYWAK